MTDPTGPQIDPQRDTLTILKASPRLRLTKLFGGTQADVRGHVQGSAPDDEVRFAKHFEAEPVHVDGLWGLFALLQRIEVYRNWCLIRGRLRGSTRSGVQRTYRSKADQVAFFDDVPRRWLCIDVDKLWNACKDLDGKTVQDPDRLALWVLSQLPQELQDVSCVFCWSASAGTAGWHGHLSAHIYFWLAEPVESAPLREMVREWKKEREWLDPSLLTPVAVHFTAAPVFEGNWTDPLPPVDGTSARVRLIEGLDPHLDFGDLQEQWEAVKVERRARIERRAQLDPPTDEDWAKVTSALDHLGNPDFEYDDWLMIGMAIRSRWPGDEGLSLWESWSERSPKHEPDICDYKWASFGLDGSGGISLGSLFHKASEAGWVMPLPERAVPDGRETRADWGGPSDPGPPPAWMDEGPPGDGPGASASPPRPPARLRFYRLTDVGNAQRLVDLEGADLRHVKSWNKWLVWDGRRWAADGVGEATERAKAVGSQIFAEVKNSPDPKAWARAAKHAESRGGISSMMALAASDRRIRLEAEDLDQEAWILTTTDGDVDLTSGKTIGSDRTRLGTKLAGAGVASLASSAWTDFVLSIMGGDKELAAYLQRAVGYSLTGATSEQCLFLLWGGGRNGKSTFLETLADVLGDYAVTAEFGTFLERSSEAVRNDVAMLRGARFVTSVEPNPRRGFDEGLIKQLTGSDTVTARFLYGEYFSFKPTWKLWLASNHRPHIRGTDEGIWRRIHLIPFTQDFKGREDKGLAKRLVAESAGILRWAVDGCLAWQEMGLAPPQAVLDATQAYRESMDKFGCFISEALEEDAEARTSAKDLYRAYKDWCEETGHKPSSQRVFGGELAERGFEKGPIAGRIHYRGLRVAG